jgi:ribonuclease HI
MQSMKESCDSWKIFIDGASRGNPGSAGAGVCILKNDIFVFKRGFYLGKKTNNQAEYLALALALFYLHKIIKKEAIEIRHITITSDSELMIRQMNGIYKIKNPELAQIKHFIDCTRKGFSCQFKHVLRAFNTEADAMANLGIDERKKVPLEFKKQLEPYTNTIMNT